MTREERACLCSARKLPASTGCFFAISRKAQERALITMSSLSGHKQRADSRHSAKVVGISAPAQGNGADKRSASPPAVFASSPGGDQFVGESALHPHGARKQHCETVDRRPAIEFFPERQEIARRKLFPGEPVMTDDFVREKSQEIGVFPEQLRGRIRPRFQAPHLQFDVLKPPDGSHRRGVRLQVSALTASGSPWRGARSRTSVSFCLFPPPAARFEHPGSAWHRIVQLKDR